MIRTTRSRRAAAAIAGASILALGLSACGGDTEAGTDGKDITLTIATFNDFGYTDELLAEYTAANPHVKIVHNRAAKSDDARNNLITRMAAGGTGLADVEGIEVDWMNEISAVQDNFADLADPALEGRWFDWKLAQGTTAEGKQIGYGTDFGPQAVCYRGDLLEAAGLPSDRESVAELLGGEDATWEEYFAAGAKFQENAPEGTKWFDSAGAIWQGMVAQIAEPYENAADGTPKDIATNEDIKAAYTQILEASETLSGGFEQWTDSWIGSFQNNGFATMLCPGWMTGSIESNSGGVDGWDVADVFPGGGANWGGSFLTVPSKGKNVEEAKKLAAWLTAPEQQTKAFENVGAFPSQIEALETEAVQSSTNAFMNDAPVGQIFANRAAGISAESLPFKGKNYFKINQVVTDAIKRVDVEGSDDINGSWDKAVKAFNDLEL